MYVLIPNLKVSISFEQVKLAQHVYSCLFGTFLCNSESERLKANILKRTFSVWSLLKLRRKEFKNYLYSSSSEQVGFRQLFEIKIKLMFLLPQGNVSKYLDSPFHWHRVIV